MNIKSSGEELSVTKKKIKKLNRKGFKIGNNQIKLRKKQVNKTKHFLTRKSID